MIIVKTPAKLRACIRNYRRDNPRGTVGFVPTMGYLHEGHASLIRTARSQSGFCVVSIYVNPTQFGPDEDLDQYPRDEKRDLQICSDLNVDIVFMPENLYRTGHLTTVTVPGLSNSLCGQYRSGHFDGVCTVVAKLFNLVSPDTAFFGQKDCQQAIILQKMVIDLDFDIDVRILETIRESDGLAMSSRNVNISPKGRKAAPAIYRGLQAALALAEQGETVTAILLDACRRVIEFHPKITIQYLECRSTENLDILSTLDRPAVIAVAAFLDSVRLIDNIIISPERKASHGSP